MEILKIEGLRKAFGGLVAVNNLYFTLERNTIMGLIGPNGSGKTTVINLISGFYEPDGGEVYLKGEKITGLRPYSIAQKGLIRTFQLTRVFKGMTVMHNMLAAFRGGINEQSAERALRILEFLGLGEKRAELAGSLSFGEQKLLELGRALMLDPDVLLLDEPVGGVNPVMIDMLMDRIIQLRKAGKTFLVVEHNMHVVSKICDKVLVLDHGEKIAEGSFEAIHSNPRVIDAYLGII